MANLKNCIAGIDYSITGPSVCVHPIDVNWHLDNCRFLTLDAVKKNQGYWLNNTITVKSTSKTYEYDIVRYNFMALTFSDFLKYHDVKTAMIEGYSYMSSGKVFNLAEATGLMKLNVVPNNIELQANTPPVFKKFATGKGNANKEKMAEAFFADTAVNLTKVFNHNKLRAPVDNLVDSYWICKYLYESINIK